ncbi:hypothetical protein B9G79_12080 [Bdellovibrio bacteriovorus]|uniref:Recombinase zinc beta ribbon domain-containing protein n=2 Tax=Bdellovibrio bacteriovorus TaxID=959 RepID=A0A1Z3NDH2_BDEBC|nr:hypothetical protein B9G79_12080 [Bdellovibrio bacteriovorus]
MGYVKKPHQTKRLLTYRGTVTCAHCGCSITGEVKKGRYTYYRCTNGKLICDNVVYLREAELDEGFKNALRRIKIPREIIEWTENELKQSSAAQFKESQAQLSLLKKRFREIEGRLSLAYDHYLDGKITSDMWELKSKQWQDEKASLQNQLTTLELQDQGEQKNVLPLMDLASKASTLFDSMTSDEKREMLGLVLSNPQIKNGSLQYDFRFPFSYFVGIGHLEKWRGGRDSNPRPSA